MPLYATQLFEYGSQGKGYWEAEDVVRHTLDIAIPMFEAVFPGYQALFLFYNAQNHALYANDAFLVRKMNLGLGGEQKVFSQGI